MIQEPSYHLEGVIRTKDELEDFSGPLDLILMLLAKNKIEIRDIRISELLDQYLDYLHQMQEMDLNIASEFVQMASHLTYIKTKMLLTEEKEPGELELLVSALEQMKSREAIAAVREILPELEKLTHVGCDMQTRGPLPRTESPYAYSHTPQEILAAMADMLLRGNAEPEVPEYTALKKAVPRPIYNVRDKSEQILRLLRSENRMTLISMFSICRSRSELVATFLSVLELCSAGAVRVLNSDGGWNVELSESTEDKTVADE